MWNSVCILITNNGFSNTRVASSVAHIPNRYRKATSFVLFPHPRLLPDRFLSLVLCFDNFMAIKKYGQWNCCFHFRVKSSKQSINLFIHLRSTSRIWCIYKWITFPVTEADKLHKLKQCATSLFQPYLKNLFTLEALGLIQAE